ncbi:centromere protein S [Rhodotorula toruloides]|uniref:BY PROTMAP: gi/472583024/gb/EMS20686.1/ centromere protein S [Rhodosporidium toruloides NP11] gi/647396641/emb/CDR39080.1/ RHTO0S04e00826g1_1 [Rhodosporidium toruloides] n=1 Tax=Rhodotorula toruloides TaxID=5286 RepID=A0A0K3CHC1_RHOTO|nr:centromere protein S [Rhodotorula toruloides]
MPPAKATTEADEPLSRQSLKAAVWYTVTKIAQEEELSLPFAASEHFVATLAEVVFQQALSLGNDLERFANHAGRLTINVDDVKLAARRNEPLYATLTTAAIQRGLTLADLKADSKTGAKTKQVKAPRLAADKFVTGGSRDAEKAKEKDKGKGKAVVKSAKAKGKQEAVESEEDVSEEEDAGGRAGLSGGFVKASALSKGKGKKRAVVPDDEDEEMEEDGEGERGEVSGSSDEDDRRRNGKGTGKKR